MFFTPILDNDVNATFTLKCAAGDSPSAVFARLGWTRRRDLDSRTGSAYQSPIGYVFRFGNCDAARRYLADRDLGEKMRTVRINYRRTFGDYAAGSYTTAINGTDDTIRDYFIGQPVTVGLSDDPNAVVTSVDCPIFPNRHGYRPLSQDLKSLWIDALPFIDAVAAGSWVAYDASRQRARISTMIKPLQSWLYNVPDRYLVAIEKALSSRGHLLKAYGAIGVKLLPFAAIIEHQAGSDGNRADDLDLARDIRGAVLHRYYTRRRNHAASKWGADR